MLVRAARNLANSLRAVTRTSTLRLRPTVTRAFAQVYDITLSARTARTEAEAPKQTQSEAPPHTTMSRNVFQQPLQLHSTRPLTGFLRTGYCEAPSSDFGNHSVAAVVTDEFLDFSAARGNDLRQAGLTGGCKWCLCVSRWREAFEARASDTDAKVPKVYLSRTNERALEGVKLDELRKFAVDEGASNGS